MQRPELKGEVKRKKIYKIIIKKLFKKFKTPKHKVLQLRMTARKALLEYQRKNKKRRK